MIRIKQCCTVLGLHLRADAMLARQRVGSTAGTSRPAHVSSTLGYCVSLLNHMSSVTKRAGSTLNQFRASTNECNYGSLFLSLQQADFPERTTLISYFFLAVPCIWVQCLWRTGTFDVWCFYVCSTYSIALFSKEFIAPKSACVCVFYYGHAPSGYGPLRCASYVHSAPFPLLQFRSQP